MMGRANDEMMRYEELRPMYDWIEENFGYDTSEEGSEEWEVAVKEFERYCENQQSIEEEEYRQGQLEWYIYKASHLGIFQTQMRNIEVILHASPTDEEAKFSLLVMSHAHIVASVEAYLAGTFIHKVTNSEELIRKLVESDPYFSKMKFTLKEIFEKKEKLKFTVAEYLQDLIFHDLKKVKPMFKDVLNCDFGDISWLFDAVRKRHDCVHRAGLDKDGRHINLSKDLIRHLIYMSSIFIRKTEQVVNFTPER